MNSIKRALAVAIITVVASGPSLEATPPQVDLWLDQDGHLWVENSVYRWDVSHGTSLIIKVGEGWRNWRIPGYESYRMDLGRGGNSQGGGLWMSDFSVESITNDGHTAVAMLTGLFNMGFQPVALRMTFYANSGLIRMDLSVQGVAGDPNPPGMLYRMSLVPGGDVSSNDYYHYSGQSGEAGFPYNSWTSIAEPDFQTVGSTGYLYITDYDKTARQGFAMISKYEETADFITDINYGRAQILDYHPYGGYCTMSIHPNTVVSPTVYWYFYETDSTTPYLPVEDLINSGELLVKVALDIKPGSCPNPLNVKNFYVNEPGGEDNGASGRGGSRQSRAVVPGSIQDSDGVNVVDIDPATIRLEGVPPLRWSIQDVSTPVDDGAGECACTTAGADGYPDLTLKFDKKALVDSLGEVYDGQVITLTVTGFLYDGTPIEGTDCVVIRGAKPRPDPDPPAWEPALPVAVRLDGNYPNPFNPATTIGFALTEATHVQLDVFNISGQRVATLIDRFLDAGEHNVVWNAGEAASGVYLYRLTAGEFVETRKMMLLK